MLKRFLNFPTIPVTLKNTPLYESTKSYVIAAIDLINRNPDSRFSIDEWTDAPGIGFIFSHDKLKRLPEYKECKKRLEGDSIIASQLNVMIGTETGGHIAPDIENLMVRLPTLGIYKNLLEFNADYFEREYKNFEDAFYNNKIKYEVVVPVTGHLFSKPVKLSPTLDICLVSKNDLIPVLADEIGKDPYLAKTAWAIRTQYELPKIVGNRAKPNLDAMRKNDQLRENTNILVEKVISCLRLFNVSNVYPQANIHRASSLLFQRVHPFPVRSAPEFQSRQVFDKDYSEDFMEFWKNFEFAVDNYIPVAIAAKRFSYSFERHSWEDNIIDLSIAAEALFLSDISEKTELSYRLRLHASLFLGEDDIESRKCIFADFGLAYSLRSAIVHGGEAQKIIKKIEKNEIAIISEDYKLEQFISRIRHFIKIAILKMINLAILNRESAISTKSLVEWNSLVLGEKQRDEQL